MRLRSFLPNLLPDLKLTQTPDQPGPQKQADHQGRDAGIRGAEGDVLENVQYPERRPVPVQRIKEFVENVVEHQVDLEFRISKCEFVLLSQIRNSQFDIRNALMVPYSKTA